MTTVVQFSAGAGARTLNGVAAGNNLYFLESLFRTKLAANTAIAVPTDTQGTWLVANAPTLIADDGDNNWVGVGIFKQESVAAGTHTVTPADGPGGYDVSKNCTLVEVSGLLTSGSQDASNSGSTANSSHTSQTTGTTGTLAQADEIAFIAHAMSALNGAADCGYTDPVPNFTTLQSVVNTLSNVGTFHAYQIVAATTALNPTFAWTASETNMGSIAGIATFKAVSAAPSVAVSAAILPGGLNSLGTGLTRAIMPSGIGNMG